MRRRLEWRPRRMFFLPRVAMRTRRIHFGPLVYLLPLYHPMRLVEEICMLDQLSGGRLEVGVGRGISPYELAHFNVNFLESRRHFRGVAQSDRRRSARAEDFRIAASATNSPARRSRSTPKQQPNPPFWYGASTPEGLTFAARHRMQIVTGGPNASSRAPRSRIGNCSKNFRESPDNLNPQIKEPKIGAVRHFFVADTDQQAEEIATPCVSRSLPQHHQALARFRHPCQRCLPTTSCARRAADAAIVGSPQISARPDCGLLRGE